MGPQQGGCLSPTSSTDLAHKLCSAGVQLVSCNILKSEILEIAKGNTSVISMYATAATVLLRQSLASLNKGYEQIAFRRVELHTRNPGIWNLHTVFPVLLSLLSWSVKGAFATGC